MAEALTELQEEIHRQYRLLGYKSFDDGFEQLDQEVSGLLGEPAAEVKHYLHERTEHIENPKDRKSAMRLLEGRISALKMGQEA